jgi:NAD(P)-dependent dehydrogenase (short-subunit alcohol dehydrogenase family)
MFYLTAAAHRHLKEAKGCVINTTSVTAFRGSGKLLDYSSSKGAILAFTRSLSEAFAPDRIRVNAVAPGPIWTPLIPSTFPPDKVDHFGADVAMERPGQPFECAGAYVYLASADASYISGQTIHVNGGEVVNA